MGYLVEEFRLESGQIFSLFFLLNEDFKLRPRPAFGIENRTHDRQDHHENTNGPNAAKHQKFFVDAQRLSDSVKKVVAGFRGIR